MQIDFIWETKTYVKEIRINFKEMECENVDGFIWAT
jgi:hypothetical protein